jgi:hypothetical protein
MSEPGQGTLEQFVQTVIDNLHKNGFPEHRVAFPLDRMYERADAKGLSFNKVLDALAALGIAHDKTTEKVIFRSTAHEAAGAPAGPFAGLDLAGLQDLPADQRMAAAVRAMQQLSPDQMQAVRGMLENMTEAQREELLEQAKKLGMF